MRKYLNTLTLCLSLLIGLMAACTSNFDDINKNEYVFKDTEVEFLLPGVMKSTLDLVGGEMNTYMFLPYAHYAGGQQGVMPEFFYEQVWTDGWWRRWYVQVMKNLDEIERIHNVDNKYANRIAIARIWKNYAYSVMVSTYGMVPFEEALNAPDDIKDGIFNKFDNEELIYETILTDLKAQSDSLTINIDKDVFKNDPIYSGSNDNWIRFANSLRLKIAMRVSDAFPELAATHVNEIMNNDLPMIEDNMQNAVLDFGTIEENWSFIYSNAVNRNNLFLWPKMNHQFMVYLKSFKDPRTSVFADPAKKPFEFVDTLFSQATNAEVAVRYKVPYVGWPLARNYVLPDWDLDPNLNPLQSTERDNFADFNEDYLKQDMAFPIVTAAQVSFLKAEAVVRGWGAGQSAQENYLNGIAHSFAQHGIPSLAFDEYIEQDGVKWGTVSEGDLNFCGIVSSSVTEDPLEKIITQRWIADFNQGHDGWCLQKRTRKMIMSPHLLPSRNLALRYLDFPERVVYGADERNLNTKGYNGMLEVQGGDDMTTPIKISKSKDHLPAWEKYPAKWSWDFVHAYYGENVEDLDKAGVAYEIIK